MNFFLNMDNYKLHGIYTFIFWIFLCFGLNLTLLRAYFWLCGFLQNNSWLDSSVHIWCWSSNWGWLCTRKAPYFLYHLSGSPFTCNYHLSLIPENFHLSKIFHTIKPFLMPQSLAPTGLLLACGLLMMDISHKRNQSIGGLL